MELLLRGSDRRRRRRPRLGLQKRSGRKTDSAEISERFTNKSSPKGWEGVNWMDTNVWIRFYSFFGSHLRCLSCREETFCSPAQLSLQQEEVVCPLKTRRPTRWTNLWGGAAVYLSPASDVSVIRNGSGLYFPFFSQIKRQNWGTLKWQGAFNKNPLHLKTKRSQWRK